ncbi:MAG TPA: efflux RND transporter periplasmic adaptor subunit [Pirellulales bacterium]|nr:efflux RND transporter periplasmic adaptor subunit [Pirellulales bacterium]
MFGKQKLAFFRPSIVFALLGLGLLLSIASGCDREQTAAAEQPVPKVTTTEVVQQETTDYDEYTGKTEASEAVEVRARVFGYLKSIEFKDGDFVKEGQVLFTIEPDEYDAVNNQALSKIAVWEAKLKVAQANLSRRQALMATPGAISREELEEYAAVAAEAEASLNAAKADANRTAIDLKYTVVRAPISGRIDRAMVAKGTLLTGGTGSGTLLTKIVDEQPMYVYFDVDERSLLHYMRQRTGSRNSDPGSLRELGIDCYVQLADEKDFAHQGKLDFAESEVNTSTGTARLRGVFENKDDALSSGLFVRVRVPASQPYQALLIPERALATDQNVKYVYVVGDDGIANRRTVELGPQRGELRIISDGLKAGERVIVKGLQRVRPGQKVEAESEAAKVATISTKHSVAE